MSDLVAASDLTPEQARAFVDSVRRNVEEIGAWIVTAVTGRAWIALGYPSWDAMCEAEFDGAVIRLPREDRREAVASLREAGLSTRAIAGALGVDAKTVRNDAASTGEKSPVDRVTSLDGRERPSTQPERPAPPPNVDPHTGQIIEPTPEIRDHEFTCQDCGAWFSLPVWHCVKCDSHYHQEDERCHNCYQPRGDAEIAVSVEAAMTEEEARLRDRVNAGHTVVASYRKHHRLIGWAAEEQRLTRIDRRSDWGNPFQIPDDGDRSTVIANYRDHYLPYKPSLLNLVRGLRGEVLACWCAPEPCHGDVLAAMADEL